MARNDLLSVADAIGAGTPENVFARMQSIEACAGETIRDAAHVAEGRLTLTFRKKTRTRCLGGSA